MPEQRVGRGKRGGRGRGKGRGRGNNGAAATICFDFQKGVCTRGDTCKYAHVSAVEAQAVIAAANESSKGKHRRGNRDTRNRGGRGGRGGGRGSEKEGGEVLGDVLQLQQHLDAAPNQIFEAPVADEVSSLGGAGPVVPNQSYLQEPAGWKHGAFSASGVIGAPLSEVTWSGPDVGFLGQHQGQQGGGGGAFGGFGGTDAFSAGLGGDMFGSPILGGAGGSTGGFGSIGGSSSAAFGSIGGGPGAYGSAGSVGAAGAAATVGAQQPQGYGSIGSVGQQQQQQQQQPQHLGYGGGGPQLSQHQHQQQPSSTTQQQFDYSHVPPPQHQHQLQPQVQQHGQDQQHPHQQLYGQQLHGQQQQQHFHFHQQQQRQQQQQHQQQHPQHPQQPQTHHQQGYGSVGAIGGGLQQGHPAATEQNHNEKYGSIGRPGTQTAARVAPAASGGGGGGSSAYTAGPATAAAAAPSHLKHLTQQRFDQLPNISPQSLRAITEVLGYEFMSKVQAQSLPIILKGYDVLARAKTGTGKTMGFLLPAVEKMAQTKPNPRFVSVLVLSPTRELASQIQAEAVKLTKFHPIEICCVVGGTNINTDKKRLARQVDILVATPGRLQDHLKNTEGVVQKLGKLQVLALDEADQLLEMGFRPDIERILSMLGPMAGRQTLLFSATVPDGVHKVSKLAMKADHKYIDCIDPSEDSTNIQVDQTKLVVSFEQRIYAIVQLLADAQRNPAAKVIVFFSTARECGHMSELCNFMNIPVLEIHSRKSQGHRTKTAEQFKQSTTAVLFSSDVSARGMDYPDVTNVIQVGITTKEQYIHRLGRTARAGKSGQGCILLVPFEARHMDRTLAGLPLVAGAPVVIARDISIKVQEALGKVPTDFNLAKSAEQCYQAWLGFHNSNLRALGWDKRRLVEIANHYALLIGCREPPTLEKRTVGKMGLKGVPGLRLK